MNLDFSNVFDCLNILNENAFSASKQFWNKAKTNIIDVAAFEEAYMSELEKFDLDQLINKRTGLLENSYDYGKIKHALDSNPDSWALKALLKLWVLQFRNSATVEGKTQAMISWEAAEPERKRKEEENRLAWLQKHKEEEERKAAELAAIEAKKANEAQLASRIRKQYKFVFSRFKDNLSELNKKYINTPEMRDAFNNVNQWVTRAKQAFSDFEELYTAYKDDLPNLTKELQKPYEYVDFTEYYPVLYEGANIASKTAELFLRWSIGYDRRQKEHLAIEHTFGTYSVVFDGPLAIAQNEPKAASMSDEELQDYIYNLAIEAFKERVDDILASLKSPKYITANIDKHTEKLHNLLKPIIARQQEIEQINSKVYRTPAELRDIARTIKNALNAQTEPPADACAKIIDNIINERESTKNDAAGYKSAMDGSYESILTNGKMSTIEDTASILRGKNWKILRGVAVYAEATKYTQNESLINILSKVYDKVEHGDLLKFYY